MGDTIHVRGEGGAIIPMDLPLPEPIADRLEKGLLRRVNADGSPFTGGAGESGPEVPAPPLTQPAKAAPKDQWVGWAVVCGADPEEAAALTKNDLIEKYGAATGE